MMCVCEEKEKRGREERKDILGREHCLGIVWMVWILRRWLTGSLFLFRERMFCFSLCWGLSTLTEQDD